MRHKRLFSCLGAAMLAFSVGLAPLPADAATGPLYHQGLAKAQTKLLMTFDNGTGSSPARCGRGQPLDGVHGAFLLPVLSGAGATSRTVRCRTTARRLFIDSGGALITEDLAGPSYPLPFPNGSLVPFNRPHLEAICDDVVENLLPAIGRQPARVTVDGRFRAPMAVTTPWFVSRISRSRSEYAASVELGHPGRLATGFCGYKVLVRGLDPGRHIVKVNYSDWAETERTVFTYKVRVLPKQS